MFDSWLLAISELVSILVHSNRGSLKPWTMNFNNSVVNNSNKRSLLFSHSRKEELHGFLFSEDDANHDNYMYMNKHGYS